MFFHSNAYFANPMPRAFLVKSTFDRLHALHIADQPIHYAPSLTPHPGSGPFATDEMDSAITPFPGRV